MALSQEQIDQLEFNQAAQATQQKLELVRISKEILLENDRSKPADERGVTAADITTYAQSLLDFVTG